MKELFIYKIRTKTIDNIILYVINPENHIFYIQHIKYFSQLAPTGLYKLVCVCDFLIIKRFIRLE